MAKTSPKTFFIAIHKHEGEPVAHAVSTDPSRLLAPKAMGRPPEAPKTASTNPGNFAGVLQSFMTTMESYRRFIPMTFGVGPIMLQSFASQRMTKFAHVKGKERPDLSTEHVQTFELGMDCFREFRILNDEIDSAIEGVEALPEIALIGLVSAYDAFLANLLKTVLEKHDEIFFTSAKSISFSDLLKFEPIVEAKANLVEREVEGVIRSSHHEQFEWMEKNFALSLRSGLKVWPIFLEVCERRNLMTHTGGVVSKQYLTNCKTHKSSISDIRLGDKLTVTAPYYKSAVNAVYEVGVKLCYVLWRKFEKSESPLADQRLNELGFDLIHRRAYDIAEAILEFGVHGVKGKRNEQTLSMMTINLANAILLQNREAEAKSLLQTRDWSASNRVLKIGVAAVSGDIDQVVKLVHEIGANGDIGAEDYRSWPVFRSVRTNRKFITDFERVFREPFIAPASVGTQSSGLAKSASLEPESPPTKH